MGSYKNENKHNQVDFSKLAYPDQVIEKMKFVKQTFSNRKIHKNISPLLAAKQAKHYRHKVTASATNIKKHGKRLIKLGLFIENTHEIRPSFRSILHDKKIESVLVDIENQLQTHHLTAYEKGYNKGIIKHVLIRKSYATNNMLVVFVTQGHIFPNAKKIIQALRIKHPYIQTVVQIIQKKDTHIVLYGDERILFGPGYIVDQIDHLSFRLSAKSFYQVNPEQMLVLYHEAFKLANIKTNDYVMDCYSGIGTLSLLAAKQAKQVIAVEMNQSAVKDAIKNAKQNNIKNITFVQDDVEHYMKTHRQTIDVLLVDPPRIGLSKTLIDAVKHLKPKKIVYISCFVETQARDVQQLLSYYDIKHIQPMDMFPYTNHVETITLLSLKTA